MVLMGLGEREETMSWYSMWRYLVLPRLSDIVNRPGNPTLGLSLVWVAFDKCFQRDL